MYFKPFRRFTMFRSGWQRSRENNGEGTSGFDTRYRRQRYPFGTPLFS